MHFIIISICSIIVLFLQDSVQKVVRSFPDHRILVTCSGMSEILNGKWAKLVRECSTIFLSNLLRGSACSSIEHGQKSLRLSVVRLSFRGPNPCSTVEYGLDAQNLFSNFALCAHCSRTLNTPNGAVARLSKLI